MWVFSQIPNWGSLLGNFFFVHFMKNLKKKNGKVLDFKVPIGVVLCTFFFWVVFWGCCAGNCEYQLGFPSLILENIVLHLMYYGNGPILKIWISFFRNII